jgi:heat shock protein HtpX
MKRILLFLVTNLAVVAVLSIVARITGLDRWLAVNGQSYVGLLVMAALFGFGGSLISLAMSKWMAKRAMGVKVIEQPTTAEEQWLVQPNAFATGARRNAALVAVSTGLLRGMSRSEVSAVLGHEITHVANGDMVTLTLIQGVVNTFVIFLARVIGGIVDRALSRDGQGRGGMGYFMTVMVTQMVLGIAASMIVMWFSRRREFRADAGGAQLSGRNNMIAALERLKSAQEPALPGQLAAFGIGGGRGRGLQALFMSHPPLEERIAALQSST